MIDFADIEQELNGSPTVRQRFMMDPVGFLRMRGVVLSEKQEHDLRQSTLGIRTTQAQGARAGVVQRGQFRFVTYYEP